MWKFRLFFVYSFFALIPYSANANLLSNPGFESGLTGWQSSGGAAIRTSNPPAYEGQNYLYGASTPLFSVWQDIDLLGAGFSASDIDAGLFALDFGGWQSGYLTQQDSGSISIHLFDAGMTEIIGFVLPNFYSNHTWVEQSGTAALMAGTRTIRYEFIGTRVLGSNNDAYLDAAYLNVSTVPLPAGLWLLGSGVLGLMGVASKRRRYCAN